MKHMGLLGISDAEYEKGNERKVSNSRQTKNKYVCGGKINDIGNCVNSKK